jgi:hypothetical protein
MMQTHMTESRKPAFRWLGTKDDLVGPASRKRMAGMCSTAQHPIYSSLPPNKTGRGVKRFPGTENMVKGDQTVLKRAALNHYSQGVLIQCQPTPKSSSTSLFHYIHAHLKWIHLYLMQPKLWHPWLLVPQLEWQLVQQVINYILVY